MSDRVPRAMRADNVMDDVFCMVKEKMASEGLCQDPLLVFPGSLIEKSRATFVRANDGDCPLQQCNLEKERLDEIRLLARAIRKDFPHMTRTISFYESLLAPPHAGTVPQLSWLRYATTHDRRDWSAVQLGRRPLGPKPHELQVVFHRARV